MAKMLAHRVARLVKRMCKKNKMSSEARLSKKKASAPLKQRTGGLCSGIGDFYFYGDH